MKAAGKMTVLAVLLGLVASFFIATAAQASVHTFSVDSLEASGAAAKDAVPGDGVCATSSGSCTMRAALEESNALGLPAGSITITAAPGLAGNINPANLSSSRMVSGAVSVRDSAGAFFAVTAPVVIDMGSAITFKSSTDNSAAMFFIDSADVQLLNMHHVLSGESSFVMGPMADRVLVEGGESATSENYNPERFVLFREGAKNITVRDYRIQGFYHRANNTGIFFVNAQNSTPVKNIVIDNVRITYPTSNTCTLFNGAGCQTDILQFSPRSQNVVLDGFTFKNSFVSNLSARAAFPFSSSAGAVKAGGIQITGNDFINVQGAGTGPQNAFITLPQGPLSGANSISGNRIVRADKGQSHAVAWESGSGELSITGNYFDGYSSAGIYLADSTDVQVQRNSFGARSASQPRPGIAEESGDGAALLLDIAPEPLKTWYPSSSASVVSGPAPTNSYQVPSPIENAPMCLASLEVTAPAGAQPESDLDVYWSADRTAEVYLGRAQKVRGDSAVLLLNLPVGAVEYPSTVVGENDSVQIIDEDSGAASGYLRVQTLHGTQSSQYSRLAAFSGNCRPELSLEQAKEQNDPTPARDLHYTLSSSLPLNPESVPAALKVKAEPVEQSLDASKLNPRRISAAAVPGSENREFDVVIRVDDSAAVTVSVPAGSVQSSGGLSNRSAAVSKDATIVFTNPIRLTPGSFALVRGEPAGKDYSFELAAGAPAPVQQLKFSLLRDQSAMDYGVKLAAAQADIEPGQMTSQKIKVSAAQGEVPANTPAAVSHKLTSDDPNYDGLLVAPLKLRLFAVDPAISISKRAFVEVKDATSPQSIMATGTEALAGTRLKEGQGVCFVYEVRNISADDWETVLRDVRVTDSDARLGADGLIDVIEQLPIGGSATSSACTTLIAKDTTGER